MPYYGPTVNSVVQYQNPNTVQIIAAGRDQMFGSTTANGGVIWNPSGQGAMFSMVSGTWPATFTNAAGKTVPFQGQDDCANFCANILGAGNAQ
jgi:hypothetical protein